MQVQIRGGYSHANELNSFVERRLQFALARFSGRIRSTIVRFQDLNGPRGGVDQECRISIYTYGGTQIVITERSSDVFEAVSRAADRAGRAVGRQVNLKNDSRVRSRSAVNSGD